MKRALLPFFVLPFLFIHASDPVYKEVLKKRLDYIFKDDSLKKSKLSVAVYSLNRAEKLYELNADESLSSASAIKVFTGYTALKRLGTNFTFKTEIYTDGQISGNTLKGNLYLKGGGDPALVTERLYLIAERLPRWNIKHIEGNIIVDESIFSTNGDESRLIDTAHDRPYNASVTGISFNYNTTTVYFRPGFKIGDPVRAYPEPDTGFINIQNNSKTISGNGNSLKASRQSIKGVETLVVSGSMGINASEQRSFFNVSQPALYAGTALNMMLKQQGIFLKGKVTKGETPSKVRKIMEFESQPLRELVLLMNKFSNNFMADSLVKVLGLNAKGAPGTISKGLDVLKEEATLIGINNNGFKITSGSGLSRENRTSANHYIKIMENAFNNFEIFPELMTSLPIASVDGTLRRRMQDTAASKRLRGKTGTIFGVSSIVGAVQSRGGELLAYAVIINDNSKEPGAMHPWQNYLGQALSDFNRQAQIVK